MLFGLTACSDSRPTSSVQRDSQQEAQSAEPGIQLPVGQSDQLNLPSVLITETLPEQPIPDLKQASTELDQSMLKSLSRLSQIQGQSIEANSVKELEQLSEADRQALQAIAAQQTMSAAERLAAKQVDKSTERISIK